MMKTVSLACAILLSAHCVAVARDIGQWDEATPIEVRQWYARQMVKENPHVSCCGEADAYWADKHVVKDGVVFVIITDNRPDGPLRRPHIEVGTLIEVPANRFNDSRRDPNPTGHNVVFINHQRNLVLCFVDSSGL